MGLQLDIAGFGCDITSSSTTWESHMRKKYSPFLSNRKSDLLIRMHVNMPKYSVFSVASTGIRTYDLFIPSTKVGFRQFNFMFKTIIASYLLFHGGFIIHASAKLRKHRAVLFTGKEGSGKSTIAKLLSEYRTLNDDFAIIRNIQKRYYVYSSPFYEKNPFPKQQMRAALEHLYFLHQAKVPAVLPVKRQDAIVRIISLLLNPISFMPSSWKATPQTYTKRLSSHLIVEAQKFCDAIPHSMLHFSKDRTFLPHIL